MQGSDYLLAGFAQGRTNHYNLTDAARVANHKMFLLIAIMVSTYA
jgi:hypothetical protein